MADRKPNAVSCFAWHWSPNYPAPGDVTKRGTDLIPPYAICQVTGVLNPIATEDPILICDSLLMDVHNGAASSTLVANGPSWVKQREPFTGYMLTHPTWARYYWPAELGDLEVEFPEGEDTTDDDWPQYWAANPMWHQWSLTPYAGGLGGTSGAFRRIGRPDKVRQAICVIGYWEQ